MKVKYLTTLAAMSVLSLGLAVGCAQQETTPTTDPAAAPPAEAPATTNPCAAKDANPCAAKDEKPADATN
ncbi:MAG: hypothetical protein WBB29_10160 [Geitlerinemataceae cyanobacterium]